MIPYFVILGYVIVTCWDWHRDYRSSLKENNFLTKDVLIVQNFKQFFLLFKTILFSLRLALQINVSVKLGMTFSIVCLNFRLFIYLNFRLFIYHRVIEEFKKQHSFVTTMKYNFISETIRDISTKILLFLCFCKLYKYCSWDFSLKI